MQLWRNRRCCLLKSATFPLSWDEANNRTQPSCNQSLPLDRSEIGLFRLEASYSESSFQSKMVFHDQAGSVWLLSCEKCGQCHTHRARIHLGYGTRQTSRAQGTPISLSDRNCNLRVCDLILRQCWWASYYKEGTWYQGIDISDQSLDCWSWTYLWPSQCTSCHLNSLSFRASFRTFCPECRTLRSLLLYRHASAPQS